MKVTDTASMIPLYIVFFIEITKNQCYMLFLLILTFLIIQ